MFQKRYFQKSWLINTPRHGSLIFAIHVLNHFKSTCYNDAPVLKIEVEKSLYDPFLFLDNPKLCALVPLKWAYRVNNYDHFFSFKIYLCDIEIKIH